MNLAELVRQNRTYRRFHQETAIDEAALRALVDLARLSASGGNLQSLCYLLSWQAERNARIFPHLAWAGYLKDWGGPKEGERPSAYVVILNDTEVQRTVPGTDVGIAAQSIMLGAAERGFGGCMIGSIRRDTLRAALGIPPRYEIALVLALGLPSETVVVETARGGAIKYWRDAQGVHHVPKRSLEELILTLP